MVDISNYSFQVKTEIMIVSPSRPSVILVPLIYSLHEGMLLSSKRAQLALTIHLPGFSRRPLISCEPKWEKSWWNPILFARATSYLCWGFSTRSLTPRNSSSFFKNVSHVFGGGGETWIPSWGISPGDVSKTSISGALWNLTEIQSSGNSLTPCIKSFTGREQSFVYLLFKTTLQLKSSF